MSHRFDGGCMDPKYGGEAGSEPPHVAQQSRRDKLRVQGGQQFGHDPNPNPSHDFIYSSAAAGMLDFASAAAEANEANNSFLGAGSCDWIVNSAGPSSSSMYGDYTNFSHHSLHFSPLSSSYHNTLHEVVAPSSNDQGGLEMMGSLSLPPPPMPWLDTRQLFQHQYDQEFPRNDMPKVAGGGDRYQINQGLSLSLSSNPPPSQLDARGHSASLDPRKVISSGSGSSSTAGGPLGPFTGYATILKSSKFLKPAQQLLDEFCSAVTGSSSRGESASSSAAGLSIDGGAGIGGRGANNSGMSPSSFYSSTEGGSSGGQYYQQGGVSCDQVITPLPEIQQKKVKLLYLQDEVCRRYKQYHQQMQMVVSSFESVAGISAATPYTSLAVKSVSKHFRCVKNAISDQLRQVSKLVGEELMSSPSSASRGETTMTPRLKYVDQGFRKHRGGENSSLGFMENNQPVWRPQRGLPERAVAVLRAWLFEHFLHPYPTDTDKHMLATQTGLSRNQVSNWFINARVRLWKPMVEEIHSLESKGMAEMDLNSSNKKDGKAVMDDNGAGRPYHDQLSEAQSNKSLDPTSMGGPPIVNESSSIDMEQWHREKRTRMEECSIPQNMDGGLMSFAYQGGMDLGSLGAVSLTLGLRHNEDPQQQQQQQQQMRHFGSQMLHDFVG